MTMNKIPTDYKSPWIPADCKTMSEKEVKHIADLKFEVHQASKPCELTITEAIQGIEETRETYRMIEVVRADNNGTFWSPLGNEIPKISEKFFVLKKYESDEFEIELGRPEVEYIIYPATLGKDARGFYFQYYNNDGSFRAYYAKDHDFIAWSYCYQSIARYRQFLQSQMS